MDANTSIRAASVCALIQVFDMPASFTFYRDKLGCEIVATGGPENDTGWALLKLDQAYFMLNTMYELHDRPAAPDPARIAAHQDTALYFECPNVDEVYTLLAGRGIAKDPPANAPYGMRQLYIVDPDGYHICFQHPVGHHEE
jgi:catechol 2,3-dioxygenase-like lactoylglutathione lyase family enzyme